MIRLLRFCAAAALVCAFAGTASAAVVAPRPDPAPIVVAQAPTAPVTVPTATPGTQITTTAPVTSDTTISVGTLMGEILKAVLALFTATIGTALTAIMVRMFAGIGVSVTDANRKRLQQMVETGLSYAASKVEKTLDGKIPLDLKSKVLADTVRYVQTHGADTLKSLGGVGPDTIEAIEARAEKALADPAVPVSVAVQSSADSMEDKIQKGVEAVLTKLAPKPA